MNSIIKRTRAIRLKPNPNRPLKLKRKKRPPQALKNVTRTPGTIIRTLNSPRRPQGNVSHYALCRSNPFAGHGGSSIPDGKNTNFVVTDTFTVNTFTPTTAGQTIVIQTLNCLPSLAMIASTAGLVVDSTAVAASSALQPTASTASTTWYPIGIPGPYVGTGAAGALFADPYNSTTARVISVGYRLLYIGPATTCAGSITITPNPVAWGTTSTSADGGFGLVPPTIAGAAGTQLHTGAVALDVDMTINPVVMTRASLTVRPEQGLYVVPKHKSTEFKLQPTYNMPYAPIANANTSLLGNLNTLFRPSGGVNPGVVFFDNDWMTYQIVITGLNSDASFRLETVLCMEYNPAVSSPFYPLSIKQSPDSAAQLHEGQKASERTEMKGG